MNNPPVSIIMNCYNGEEFLIRYLKSIIDQTYSNWELIFWDNHSTDQSKKIFMQFEDKRFKYFRPDKFKILYDARNDALEKCEGKYITFLDVDDYWFSEKLSKQVKLLESNKNIGLVYTNYLKVNMNKLFFKKKEIDPKIFKSGTITEDLIKNYFIGFLTVMIRKSFMNDELKNFDSKYNMLSDFDYILRFSMKYKIDYIKDILAVYNQHENQLQLKNISIQVIQLNEWFKKKVIDEKLFGEIEDFSSIKEKIEFLNFIKDIKNKNFFLNMKNLLFYKNNSYKIKLFFLLFFPKKFVEKIFSLT